MPEGFLEQVINGLMMGSIYVLVAKTHRRFEEPEAATGELEPATA